MIAEAGKTPRIAVLGAGAVGCYFGGVMARAGLPVTFIARTAHRQAMERTGLRIESFRFPAPEYVRVQTAADASGARDADIVLFCVKTVDTEIAARELAAQIEPGAVVVSMQNGVDNVPRMRASSGIDALGAAVYVAAEMIAPGVVRHSGRGDLIIGRFPGSSTAADIVEAAFAASGIPCRISPDIRAPLWTKMFINCGYNAISALGRSRYGWLAARPEVLEIMRRVVEEAVAVARAEGVPLPDEDFVDTAWKLANSMTQAYSSTAQDIARGKKTEIDSLNGYVARRGREFGIDTPMNYTLWALVKLLENREPDSGDAAPSA